MLICGLDPADALTDTPSRQPPPEVKKPAKPKDRVLIVTAFKDPMKEMDKLHDLYLDSLTELGIDLKQNDVRFVEDDWESPTLGAWGL